MPFGRGDEDRAPSFSPAEPLCDLARSEARDVPEDEHFALVDGESVEREPQRLGALDRFVFEALVARPKLLDRDRAPCPYVIERSVSGHPQDPCRNGTSRCS